MFKALILLVMMAPAVAMAASETRAMVLDQSQRFPEQRTAIETALADGETYAEIDPAQREEVMAALARMATVLEESGGADGMSEEQKISVFNDQELVNTILKQAAADSRVVCRRETKVGSRLAVNRCESVADRRRSIEAAKETMRTIQRPQPRLDSN